VATVWVVLSKTVWVDVLGNAEPIIPFPNPGIVSIPLAFIAIWFFSITDKTARAERERNAFDALTVRSQTGIGRTGEVAHWPGSRHAGAAEAVLLRGFFVVW